MLSKKIQAFTLAELLVTLALTAILISLSYAGLNYVQKLLKQYNEQSFFITQLTELNKRISYQTTLSREIYSTSQNMVFFYADSDSLELQFYPQYILFKKNNRTDSFLVGNSNLELSYEPFNVSKIRLVNTIEFDIKFSKQKFHCTFNKNYDAYTKFILESKDADD